MKMPQFPIMAVAVLAVLAGGCSSASMHARGRAAAEADVAEAMTPRIEGAGILGRDWVFVEIAGFEGPLPSPPPIAGFIMTAEGGHVRGTTACNTLSAGYDLDANAGRLRFVKLRNARMLCDRVAADTEEAVLEALIRTDSFQVSGDTLVLYAKGEFVARLTSPD